MKKLAMTLRLEPGTHLDAQRCAAWRGMDLTTWIRRAITEKIARDRQEAGR